MKAIKGFILNRRDRWKRLGAVFCVALIYVAPILTIPGMAAIFMKMEGIKGDVTAVGYEGWIEVHSAQFGVGRSITSGGAGGRSVSAPNLSDFVITKSTDSNTPVLFLDATTGTKGRQVDINFVQTGADKLETYYAITLSDVLVTGFSQSSGGDRPTESLSLNYTKFKMSYTPYDNNGKAGTPITAGYDLTTGKRF